MRDKGQEEGEGSEGLKHCFGGKNGGKRVGGKARDREVHFIWRLKRGG